MNAVFAANTWITFGPWVVPVMGLVVCGLAYLVGRLFFMRAPTTDSSEAEPVLSANFLQGVTRERRVAPRRKGNSVEVDIILGPDQEPIHGWVHDRSIGGLGLLTDEPIPEGAYAKVRPRKTDPLTPWTDVSVRSCRREGLQYEVGFQFNHTPNWSLLMQFG